MSTTITQVKEHLTAMGHGGTLNKVRNPEAMFERAANTLLGKADILDAVRIQPLTQAVHDDVYNYSLASDYGKMIDLIPQDTRGPTDQGFRMGALPFDLKKAVASKQVSIESNGAVKYVRINWRSRSPKTLNAMNGLTDNGTWSAVGTATGLKANSLYKVSGSASIEFDVAASGDGIENSTMTALDLSEWDELADFFFWLYVSPTTNLTSVSGRFGNDLTANYWTPVAQTTQADGTAFKAGWNLIRFQWATATETGTVAPATIDSFRITLTTAGAIANARVDNITVSLGRNFDMKYYSKYLFKNSAGTWITRPTTDDDVVVTDGLALNLFLYECLVSMAQQVEGTDSAFDITFAKNELKDLYPKYRSEYPSQALKQAASYFTGPNFRRF